MGQSSMEFSQGVYKLANLSSQTHCSSNGSCTGNHLFGEGVLTQSSSQGEIKYQDTQWEQKNSFQWQIQRFVSSPLIASGFPRVSSTGSCYHLRLCWVWFLRFNVNLHNTSEKCKNHEAEDVCDLLLPNICPDLCKKTSSSGLWLLLHEGCHPCNLTFVIRLFFQKLRLLEIPGELPWLALEWSQEKEDRIFYLHILNTLGRAHTNTMWLRDQTINWETCTKVVLLFTFQQNPEEQLHLACED